MQLVEPSLDSLSERPKKGSQQRVGSVFSRFNSSTFSLNGILQVLYRKTLSIFISERYI